LLGKALFDWDFVGTEINEKSYNEACRILEENRESIGNSIELRKVEEGILKGNLNRKEVFAFLCCNPPFYTNRKQREMIEKKNFVGNSSELYYKHGEVGFINDLIKESVKFVRNFKLYTCFLQKIESVQKIQKILKDLEFKYTNLKVKVFFHEQKMGRLSRYFLGWSYLVEGEGKLIFNEKYICSIKIESEIIKEDDEDEGEEFYNSKRLK